MMGSSNKFLRKTSMLVLCCVGFVMVANQFNNESTILEQMSTTPQYDGAFLHRMLRSAPKVVARTSKEMGVLKHQNLHHRSWILAVINTPKTGTGSFQASIQRSFGCGWSSKFESFSKVRNYQCPNGNMLRTHVLSEGKEVVKALQKETPSDRTCMVFTAIRDPQTRLPSYFMENHKRHICTKEWAESHTTAQVLEMYQQWLISRSSTSARPSPLPQLLEEFGSTSLVEEFEKMDANGGYAKLKYPSDKGDFRNCELLFLRMEDSENWHAIIESEIPGIEYWPNMSREDRCPHIKEHYQALKDYKFTMEEKIMLTKGDPWMEDYFRLYGHDIDHDEEKKGNTEIISKPARRSAKVEK